MATAMAELFQIQQKYPVGKDEHYMFSYLANPFVEGPSRRDLGKMKLSEMKKVFEKEHGEEAISLIRMLLLACSNDKDSSDKLKRYDSCADAQFAGKSVKPDKRAREEYNLRLLLVNVVKDLDESQLNDMATLIEDDASIICNDKSTKLQNLLLQLERAIQQNVILPQKVDKLMEWLKACQRNDLRSRVNQFDPKKQFPGAATGDEVVVPVQNQFEQRSEQGGQNGGVATAIMPVTSGVNKMKLLKSAAAVDEVVVPVQNQSEQRSEQGGQNVPVQDQTELHRQLSEQGGPNGGVAVAVVPAVASGVNRMKSWRSGDSSFDSAYAEEDSKERSGSVGTSSDPRSMESYRTTDSKFRSNSIEEKGPSQADEMVSGRNNPSKK